MDIIIFQKEKRNNQSRNKKHNFGLHKTTLNKFYSYQNFYNLIIPVNSS
jgi:hypothetical protein